MPALHHLAEAARAFPPGWLWGTWLWSSLFNAAVGIAAGALIVGAVMLLRRLRGKPAVTPH
jgi:predicted DNA repair protein MutK